MRAGSWPSSTRAVDAAIKTLPARRRGPGEGLDHLQGSVAGRVFLQFFAEERLIPAPRGVEQADGDVAFRGAAVPDHGRERRYARAPGHEEQRPALPRGPGEPAPDGA